MKEKTIKFDTVSLRFEIESDTWRTEVRKSDTNIQDIRQLKLLQQIEEQFSPVNVKEKEDLYEITYTVDPNYKTWTKIKSLRKNDKLRVLLNISKLAKYIYSRNVLFLHPENLVFDDNLLPIVIHHGIRNTLPPVEMNEAEFLKQFKCLAVALFSKKYSFEELYNGSLTKAHETEQERNIVEAESLEALVGDLKESYRNEQKKTEREMKLVPTSRFTLYKWLSITMIAVSVCLAIPLIYFGIVRLPYEEKLLEAHRHNLNTDYDELIEILKETEYEKLPISAKYILAQAYVKVERLSDKEKLAILNNISLKSDENYLLYWIYNGKGDFEKSIDLAKYLDEPQLIMYGLIKKIEQDKNNPELTGTERDEAVQASKDALEKYREQYGVKEEDLIKDEETEVNQPIDESPKAIDEKQEKEPNENEPKK